MFTETLTQLKINKLSREQYERELANGNVEQNALYLTPDEECAFRTIPSGGDADEAMDTGLYDVANNVANFAFNNSGQLLVLRSGGNITQIAFSPADIFPRVRMGYYYDGDVYYSNGWVNMGYAP